MSAIRGHWCLARALVDFLPGLFTLRSMMMSVTSSMFMAGQILIMFLMTP